MAGFADLFRLPTRAEIKALFIGFTQSEVPPLPTTSWVPGDPSERMVEIIPRAIDYFLSNVTVQAVRAFFFPLNTDPGDAGDLSADQTPRPGWLSAFGSGWWGVQRGSATYASGFVTITNAGSTTTSPFSPFDLTFQRSTAASDDGFPTYRNSSDDAIYTGLGGTLTLAPSATATIPIVAQQNGRYADAAPGEITVLVTQSFGTLTVTNANPVLGSDREDRSLYIARCQQQSASASPNGPQDAYRYASTTGADGNQLQLWDGSGATTVNRVFVSASSSTGVVSIYLANPSGPATTVEVSSANGNINGLAIVATDGLVYNATPIGVVPDTVVIGPTVVDVTTQAPGPAAASSRLIGPIIGTARIKATRGQTSLSLIAEVHPAIEDALSVYLASPETAPIGGLDQVVGVGTIYRSDLVNTIRDSYPVPVSGLPSTPALYGVAITTPSSASLVIPLGYVPVYVGPPTISAAANNGSGLVRLTVSANFSNLPATSDQIQIYATSAAGEAFIGVWTITRVNSTHIDLQGSTFTVTFTGSMSLIIVTVT